MLVTDASPSVGKAFFVHDLAVCQSSAIGNGTRIWGFTHVLPGARIGANCNVGEHVFVENDVIIGNGCTIKNGVALWDLVTLEDDVFIGPYVVFTNELKPRAFIKRGKTSFSPTLIKKGATIGANATIVCGVTIGEYAFIGAGAVVTQDVPPHTAVLGVPARLGYRVCFCGERLSAADYCEACRLPLTANSAERATRIALGQS